MKIKRAIVPETSSSVNEGISKIRVIEEEQEQITLKSGQVLVEPYAVCINFPDLLQTANAYQHRQQFPYTPGLEFAGRIVQVGKDVRGWNVGDDIFATIRGGALSSVLVLDENQCLPLPKGFTYAEAARAQIHKEADNWILVNGATGGMGFAAVQLAKYYGLKVIATGGSDEKLEIVKKIGGADEVINYTSNPKFSTTIKEITKNNGVDVVFDPVGGKVFDEGLRSTAFGARVCVVGFTSGEHPKIAANYVLIKALSIIGCRAGEYVLRKQPERIKERIQEMLKFAGNRALKPHISATYPFTTQGVQDAFKALSERRVVGRVCVRIQDKDIGDPSKL